MPKTRIHVACGCGWRGNRVPGECACYDEYAMSCRCCWGSCPKCGGRVAEAAYLARLRRMDHVAARVSDRLWSRVARGEGCWEWQGHRSRKGYGRFFYHNRLTSAHRVAYELTYGPIPFGLQVCHTCDNPACCRPDHLWLGTNAENTQDKMRKGRYWNGASAVVQCKNGHAYTAENTGTSPRGTRMCLICHRARDVRRNRKQREARHRQREACALVVGGAA